MSKEDYYFEKLEEIIQEQQDKMKRLEREVKQLKREIRELASRPQTIEYKFEQLKVEKLDGTLHIGVGHSEDSKDLIEQFNIGQNTVQMGRESPAPSEDHADYREMMINMDRFFKEEAPLYLQSVASKFNVPLEDSYKAFIVEDVKRQVPGRLKHYLVKYEPKDERSKQDIIQKTKEDIYRGIETFILQMKDSQ